MFKTAPLSLGECWMQIAERILSAYDKRCVLHLLLGQVQSKPWEHSLLLLHNDIIYVCFEQM